MAISAADLIVRFSSDTKDAEAGMQRVNKGITGFAKSAAAVGAGILGAQAFNVITQGFAGATAGALDFGKQMANVNSIAQLSEPAFQALNDQVLALTSDPRIAQAPAELAAGLYDIYSSGFQGADGLKVLQQSALAATAGVSDTATAARVITANLNAFGLGADQAQRVSDVLFQTVADGVITFDQLANNMGNVLPIANALGLSIEDVGAAYAQMTLKGVPAAQAETQIAALMRSTLNPTEALTEAVQAHGYASAAAAVEQEGLAGFLDLVNEAAGGNQETMFDLLGTQEAMNAATILGADHTKAYRKELDRMKGASKGAGATNKALEQQVKSASFQIAKAKQAALTFATVGIGAIAPAITVAARGMTSFLTKGVTPFVSIIGKAFKGGFAFNTMLKQLPQPLRRTAHAVGTITEALGDMWRKGFSPREMQQALGGLRALGQEVHQGINVVFDTAASVAGWLWDHRDDIWGGIKSIVGWSLDNITEAVSWTLDVAAPTIGGWLATARGKLRDFLWQHLLGGQGTQAGQLGLNPFGETAANADLTVPLTNWILDVGVPTFVSKMGDFVTWYRGEVYKRLSGGSGQPEATADPWTLNASEPTIDWKGRGGSLAGWLQDKFETEFLGFHISLTDWTFEVDNPKNNLTAVDIAKWIWDSTEEVTVPLTNWKFDASEAPDFSPSWTNDFNGWFDSQVGSLFDHAVDLKDWALNVPVPEINWSALGDPFVAIGKAVQGLGDANVNWTNLFDIEMPTPSITLPWGIDELVGWVKDKVAALGGISFDLPNPLDINVPNPFGGGGKTPVSNRGEGGAGSKGYFQPMFFKPQVDRADFDTSMSDIVGSLKRQITDTTYTTTVDANIQPATQHYTAAVLLGAAWQAATFTSHLDADLSGVLNAYNGAFTLGLAWAAQTFTARFSVDVSGLYAAAAVADSVAAHIAAVMPHSPAKEGPLSKPISFQYIADDAERMASRVFRALDGALAGGRHSVGLRGPGRGTIVQHNYILKSDELVRLMKQAEAGGSFAHNYHRDLGLDGGS